MFSKKLFRLRQGQDLDGSRVQQGFDFLGSGLSEDVLVFLRQFPELHLPRRCLCLGLGQVHALVAVVVDCSCFIDVELGGGRWIHGILSRWAIQGPPGCSGCRI